MDGLTPAAGTPPAAMISSGGSDTGESALDRTRQGNGDPAGGQLSPHGYAQPADVAGRPITELGYVLALAVVAGADLAVFYQVVAVILQLSPGLSWPAVAGFTAGSLTLAHFAGRLLRDNAAGQRPGSGRAGWLLVLPWALLGLVAFVVRLIFARSVSQFGSTAVGGISPSARQLTSAIMFLALYIASGAVAGFGEYLTRNPLRARYRTAWRAYRRSLRRLARSQPRYERALNVLQVHARSRLREEHNYQAARSLRLAFADELKRRAHVTMAIHLQDPSATDGMTLADPAPFLVPPLAPPKEGTRHADTS